MKQVVILNKDDYVTIRVSLHDILNDIIECYDDSYIRSKIIARINTIEMLLKEDENVS